MRSIEVCHPKIVLQWLAGPDKRIWASPCTFWVDVALSSYSEAAAVLSSTSPSVEPYTSTD